MRRRPLLGVCLGVVAGILAFRTGLTLPFWLGLCAVSGLAAYRFARGDRIGAGLLAAVILAAVGGLLRAGTDAEARSRRAGAMSAVESAIARLRLDDAPLTSPQEGDDHRLRATVLSSEGIDGGPALPAGSRLRLYADPRHAPPLAELVPGAILHAEIRPHGARALAYPGAFSVPAYFARLDVCASATARDLSLMAPASRYAPGAALFRLRRGLVHKLQETLPDRRGAVLSAMLLGHRRAIPDPLRQRFRRTGTGHLFAISGLHVGLVTGLAWLLTRLVGGSRRTAAAAALIACGLYLGLSGARPSAVRAAVMAGVFLGGVLLGRSSDILNALAAAAVLLLLHHPPVIADAGFLLSFTAVIFLSRLGHEFRLFRHADDRRAPIPPGTGPGMQLRIRARRLGGAAWGLFLLAVAAWLGLWPLSAQYFHLVSFASLALNIFVIPWLSIVLSAGLLAPIFGLLPDGVGGPLAGVAAAPTEVMLTVVSLASRIEWLALPVNPPGPAAIGAYYGLFALFFAREGLRVRTTWFLPAGLAVVGALVLSMRPAPPPASDRITLLSGGWGECAVVETATGEVAVIGHLPRAGLDALDYLRTHHRTRLDATVRIRPPWGPDQPPSRLVWQYPGVRYQGVMIRHTDPPDPRRPPAAAGPEALFDRGPVPGCEGVRIEPIRDGKGRLLAWVVCTDTVRALVSENWWAGSLFGAIDRAQLDRDVDAAVLYLRDGAWPPELVVRDGRAVMDFRRRPAPTPEERETRWDWWRYGRVYALPCRGPTLLRMRRSVTIRTGVSDRRRFGAIRITDRGSSGAAVTAFRNGKWHPLRELPDLSLGACSF